MDKPIIKCSIHELAGLAVVSCFIGSFVGNAFYDLVMLISKAVINALA